MTSRIRDLVEELYPQGRSITGDGTRATLRRLAEEIPLELHEVPSGTQVLDWTVPEEWNIRSATLTGPDGSVVVDYDDHNLHVVAYSEPVDVELELDDLQDHLHSLPDHPDWVPYRTSFYQRDWGFCLTDRQRRELADGVYHARIDATLEPGHLTFGELVIPGETEREVLISTHVCHPSLANDNVTGMVLATELGRWLIDQGGLHHTYRLVFVPGTIGSITWLSQRRDVVDRIDHGLVLACLGDRGPMHWKQTRTESARIDRVVRHVLREHERVIDPFTPWGYDERQYSSPGFDLDVGLLSRTPNSAYPEYHTSADDLSFIDDDAMAESLQVLEEIVEALEGDVTYLNLEPYGEPQLGRRGLYHGGGKGAVADEDLASLWILNQSDGTNSLLEIAERSGLPFPHLVDAARRLHDGGLLEPVVPSR